MMTLSQIEPRTPISTAPFSIAQPGSYYLTTNLTMTSSANGININANGVTIDLNGFTISSTAASATGAGIHIGSVVTSDITIYNGHIAGGVTNNGSGVYGGPGFASGIDHNSAANPNNVLVANVTVTGCLNNGINLGTNISTMVDSCLVQTVGGNGIVAGSILRSSVYLCGSNGIVAVNASDCHSDNNYNNGIVCNGGTVSGCTANNNEYDGIDANTAAVSGCFVCTDEYGIGLAGNKSTAIGNNCINCYVGISVESSFNRVEGKQVTGCDFGISVELGSTGSVVIKNCGSDSYESNYFNDGGSWDLGPVGTVATATSPWANISQ